jgi:hypothetical protein
MYWGEETAVHDGSLSVLFFGKIRGCRPLVGSKATPKPRCDCIVFTAVLLTCCVYSQSPFGGSPPTSAGALPLPSSYLGLAALSLYGCFSALHLHVSHVRLGLFVLYCFHGCAAYVLCVQVFRLHRARLHGHRTAIASAMLLATAATSFSSLPLTAADRTLTELTECRFAASSFITNS